MTMSAAGSMERLNVVGLLSGGKDSCYNLCHCAKLGHRVVALATLCPPQGKDELDSYMYQTVGHDAVHLIAEAMGLPLYRTTIRGSALNQTSTYGERLPCGEPSSQTLEEGHDETEDLFDLLQQVKRAQPEVNAVSVGAILSNYQRVRVEHVALRAGIEMLPLSFLWQRDQAELLGEMCAAGMNAVLIKVAGAGLDEGDLGKSLVQMQSKLQRLNTQFGAHVCGEGGEYETFTLDCPLFSKRIVLDKVTTVMHGVSSSDGVFYLKVDLAHLEEKPVAVTLASTTLPPLLDKYSTQAVASIPTAADKQMHSEKDTAPLSSTRQAPTIARRERWCAIGGIQGVPSNDVEKEFASAFGALKGLLREQDLSMSHLAHLNVYLSSQAHFASLNSVYRTLFGVDPPSRACVAIPMDGRTSNIVIDAIALDERTSPFTSRRALHVQGRSHWAAANIGPYSQAVDADGRISIAGQIGLQQQTLQLVEAPQTQITLALQHARRIFKAVLEEGRVARRQGWIEGCVCWLGDARWLSTAHALWCAQARSKSVKGDDNESEDDEIVPDSPWEESWLGRGLLSSDIPTLYALLADGGLPRHAAVEWQIAAHDGDRIQNSEDAEDDDDDGDVMSHARAAQGTAVINAWTAEWHALSSKQGASAFGIACLRRSSEAGSSSSASSLHGAIHDALHLRVLYKQCSDLSTLQDVVASLLDGDSGCARTYLAVHGLFDAHAQSIDAALIWQSVSNISNDAP